MFEYVHIEKINKRDTNNNDTYMQYICQSTHCIADCVVANLAFSTFSSNLVTVKCESQTFVLPFEMKIKFQG